MESKYDIENMIETFEIHSKINEERRVKELENFPDAEWLKDEFCISKALLAICKEIKVLKRSDH